MQPARKILKKAGHESNVMGDEPGIGPLLVHVQA